ncbi:FAD-binding oxidoreductase [Natronolimnohabitans sp. A-GB9]|uniref:NAD(P)/FAD-dependent oxidoreductase n=1 Tax=Natronolimnohabitans sp. A-GB9 TaxID=3069757 RepID=UPI0027B53C63|nr:FAD-binding oxidoreductase [Natronolimnohabitans sp. A-GB9]MDQ2052175.1 FAD-binding oxidoreductase [Natronolimnohabitans sp. A-GB9]
MTDYDVIVIGSGVSGLSSAWHMAEDHDVLVIDADAIGNGTSSRASGVIMTPIDYPEWPEWTQHAVEWFEKLDGRGVLDYTEREYVRGVRPEEVEGAEEVAERDEWVTLRDPDDYYKWDDTFDEDSPYEKVLVWDEYTGYLDVDQWLPTLQHMCVKRGVEFRPDTTVEEVRVEGGEVVGVETEYRTVDADAVVAAAGSGTRPLLEDVLPLPIRKFVWNVAYLDIGLPDDYPMGGDAQEEIYWRPTRDNQLLIGIEHHYGEEDRPRERREQDDRGDQEAEPDGIRSDHHMEVGPGLEQLLNEDVPNLLNHVETADDAVRWEVCPMADSTTPDAKPIIDAPEEGPDDLVVAAGFHGAGVMATKSIGAAVRSYLTDDECPFPRDPMKLDRFDTRDTDFEFAPMTSWQEHMK